MYTAIHEQLQSTVNILNVYHCLLHVSRNE